MVDVWTPLNMHIEIMSKEAQGLPEMARTLLPVRSQLDRLGRRGGGRRNYDFSNSGPSDFEPYYESRITPGSVPNHFNAFGLTTSIHF